MIPLGNLPRRSVVRPANALALAGLVVVLGLLAPQTVASVPLPLRIVLVLVLAVIGAMAASASAAGAAESEAPPRPEPAAPDAVVDAPPREVDGILSDEHVLTEYLRDVRDSVGAQEAVLWRVDPRGGAVQPVAAASGAAAPLVDPAWMPLLQWAVDARISHGDDADPPRFYAAPLERGGAVLWVLSVNAAGGLGMPRDELRRAVSRHAAHLGRLDMLLARRRALEALVKQRGALLEAAERILSSSAPDEVAQRVCGAALEVTGAERAALVRWDRVTRTGVVEGVSPGHPVIQGTPVSPESLAAIACGHALPVVRVHGAAASGDPVVVFAPGEPPPRAGGSLGIVPLRREQDVLGALVVEGEGAAAVGAAGVRMLGLLAAIATGAVESAWHVEEVSRRARTDQLTGLWNRRHLDEQLKRLLDESDRFGAPVSIVVADIDFFKRVNDTYGHEAGDIVLRQVAQAFQEAVRTVDICARYGGEELAVLLPQTDLAGACELAERLRAAVERRVIFAAGVEIPITASFGVATYPRCVRSRDALFPSADRALYAAKREGRNRVMSARPIIDQPTT